MQIVFLGTSCMMPTKERNPIATLLLFKGKGILFDCGEGTQRQFKMAGISMAKIRHICISHWHGDHVLGLPGLLQTYAAAETGNKVTIYGPKGSKKHYANMMSGIQFEGKLDVEIKEVEDEVFYDGKEYQLEAKTLKHSVKCVGYSFKEKDRLRINVQYIQKLGLPESPLLGELTAGKEITWKGKKIKPENATYKVKGKKIAIITDTTYTKNCIDLAKDADLLIIEGTFAEKDRTKAEKYQHLTSTQSAQIASSANVKKLILTHFSSRYKDTSEILEDARTVFPNTECSYDLMKIKV